jgi:glycerol kinase
MQYLLAIDQSTSATKAVWFDIQGNAMDRAIREHRQHYPRAGWVEHDAEEIWRNVLTVTEELLARQAAHLGDLAGISIANQRETIVVFEKGSGKPLHPAIVWQCRRGDALCTEQLRKGRETTVRARTGLRIDGYFSASKLQWLIREHPALGAQLANGDALIGTMDCYLIYRLTGGQVFATDHTNASRTLLYDIGNLRWDDELCDWWQVPQRALPEIRDCDAQFGTTVLDGQLPRPAPIRGVMGDSQAALFAHRCFETGSAKVTFGTGASVLLNAGQRLPSQLQGTVASLAWVRAGQATYALEGLINCSGASLNWLRDQLGMFTSVTECEMLADEVAEQPGVYLVPAFSGLGAPYWREAARAAIVGLSAHSDRRHIIRAALESMAYQLRDVLDMMRREAGLQLQHIQCDGGPTANALLMQFTADIIGVELRVAPYPDCSALGAALMGALGAGIHPSPAALAALPATAAVYRRKMAPEQVQSRYAGWQRAVEQVLCAT